MPGSFSEARLPSGTALFTWDAACDRFDAPESLAALAGIHPPDHLSLSDLLAALHPDDAARLEAAFDLGTIEGSGVDIEVRLASGPGHLVVRADRTSYGFSGLVLRHAFPQPPRLGQNPAPDPQPHLRELEALYGNAPVGLAVLDAKLRFVRINSALAEMNGISEEAHLGRHVFDLLPGLRERAEPLFRSVLDTGVSIRGVEIEGETPREPGIVRQWVEQFYPITDETGRTTGIGIVCEEVTERKRAEHARELMSRELSHRIKNLFAVVSSLITLSARGEPAMMGLARTIRGRVEALGRAHDYVRPTDDDLRETSASRRTLQALIRLLLAPYEAGQSSGRIRIIGPDPDIGPQAATSLALAVHELATNAAKYGALSVPEGAVEIRCELDAGELAVIWREIGGPQIQGPPRHEGFGSQLARRTIAGDLDGTIEMIWAPGGLEARLRASLDKLSR
jgi:PAS domain S-box-containing protein